VPQTPPPLVGFNNNVRHHGRIFHIQTEDSGVKRPHVITHLFGDGGRILKSMKTDYSEYLGRDDTQVTVRRLMKEQHKSMFIALRSGELDPLIEEAFGPLPEAELEKPPEPVPAPPEPHKPVSVSPEELASRAAPIVTPLPYQWRPPAAVEAAAPEPEPDPPAEEPARVPSERPRRPRSRPGPLRPATPPPTSIDAAVEAMAAKAAGVAPRSRSETPPPLSAPSALRRRQVEPPGRYSISRPASIFQDAPPPEGRSLFGDPQIGEKSLDEVILSYLAEDLEPPNK